MITLENFFVRYYDYFESSKRLENNFNEFDSIININITSKNINSIKYLHGYVYDLGFYTFFTEVNITKTKTYFYQCGRMDEEIFRLGAHEVKDQNVFYNVVMQIHAQYDMPVLLSDNEALIQRRAKLHYEPFTDYLYKDHWQNTIIHYLIFGYITGNMALVHELMPLFPKREKDYKKYRFDLDQAFFEDPAKMTKAIEEIGTEKVHVKRQPYNFKTLDGDHWDNAILSHKGILYTKLAWRAGFELDIKSPLISIANPLFPIKPLDSYDDGYEFLKMNPAG